MGNDACSKTQGYFTVPACKRSMQIKIQYDRFEKSFPFHDDLWQGKQYASTREI